jgi:DNA-binding response OmpR family regulator
VIAVQVLVIEDEKRLAKALKQILEEKKYMVDVVFDGKDGFDYAVSGIYDVIILDVMLPKTDGFTVAAELRKNKIETPILMLTARDSVADRVSGLDCGADDYMTKPFAPEELLARLRALTRRRGEVILDIMEYGDVAFNVSAGELSCNGKSIHLNYKESEIFKILLSKGGVIISKEDIITRVWGYESDVGDSNVEAYISFLRKKLLFVGSETQILSAKKLGYKLEAPKNAE